MPERPTVELTGQKQTIYSPTGEAREIDTAFVPQFTQNGFTTQPTQDQKSEVGSISTKSAVNQVNDQKTFLDQTYPPVGWDAETYKNFKQANPTLEPDAQDTRMMQEAGTGKAYFINESGQEAEYTQDQLNDPTTQQFLKNNGYILTKSDGVNVGSDYSTSEIQAGLKQSNKQIENLANDFLNYNVDADPVFQAQSASIKSEFDKLQRQMEKTNYQRAQAYKTLGMRSGTTQYADEIQMGVEGEELNQANQRIADIVREEAQAISSARMAFQTNKFTEFNSKVNALKDIRDQKQKELENYNTAIANYTKKLQEEEKNMLLEEKNKFETRQKTIEGISTLVFRSLTGNEEEDAKTVSDYATMYDLDPGMLLSAVYDKETNQQKDSLDIKYKKSQIDKNLYDITHPGVNTQVVDTNGQKVLINSDTGEQIKVLGRSDTDTMTAADRIRYQADLRKEFNVLDTTKQFNTVKQSYNTVKSAYDEAKQAGKNNTTKSAADQVLIVAFNKMIDPNSVVREGEFARTTQGQSIMNRLKGAADRALEGGTGLSDNDRDAIKSATETLYKDYLKMQGEKVGEYRRYALDAGVDPNNVVRAQSLDDYVLINPDKIEEVNSAHDYLQKEFGIQDPTDEEIMQIITGEANNSFENGGVAPEVSQKITSSFKPGTWGGQCGEFTHKIVDIPSMGNEYKEKQASVDKNGFKRDEWTPQVGDVVITDASDVARNRKPQRYGHAAVVSSIKPNGDLVLIESNVKGHEKISIGRTISKDNPAIYGALRGKIKQKFLS